MDSIKRYRSCLLLFLCVTIPLGLGCKFYTGPLQLWVQNSLGGVFYEIFWCLAIAFLLIEASPVQIAVPVFIFTSILEVVQLWHPPFLEIIRSTFIGRTLIGTSFVWSDFIYYVFGCAMGFFLIHLLQKKRP